MLDIHDGELEPTLENRKKITRVIREWKADIVISHRPWDYHPDHRYVGVLVQDAAYMVTVPFICPDTPTLKKNPVFLYSSDRFQKPYPFKADIAVSIDDVFDQKVDAIHELASQHYEGGRQRQRGARALGSAGQRRRRPQGLAPQAVAGPQRRRGQPLPGRPDLLVRRSARAKPSSTPSASKSANTAASPIATRSRSCFRFLNE